MMEYRVRAKRSDAWVEKYQGAQVSPDMVNLLLTNTARVLRPDGKPLCVYLPGAAKEVSDASYPDFTKIRATTDNRGYASGSTRFRDGDQLRAVPITSAILGSFESTPRSPACRLTAFTARQVDRWERLVPFFQRISQLLQENVPDRYTAQAAEAARTPDDWVIKDTPFTTITVNNTYPTGLHTDKGDLDAGFSTLAVLRRGYYTGGWLGFPQYGVFADMQDGDVMLMDAHEWHGNTPIACAYCQEPLAMPNHRCGQIPEAVPPPERISVVSYFRTKMVGCDTAEQENEKRLETWETRNAQKMGLEPVPPDQAQANEKRGTWAERRA